MCGGRATAQPQAGKCGTTAQNVCPRELHHQAQGIRRREVLKSCSSFGLFWPQVGTEV